MDILRIWFVETLEAESIYRRRKYRSCTVILLTPIGVHRTLGPTWGDFQLLLQVPHNRGEKERIVRATQKLVLGSSGLPTEVQDVINAAFPLT